ncbi:pyridoxal-phosphate-dependent aminotransferase family protein [Thalassomonas actiniarum]|uniref:Alanine--glyoxylate aminotransferase family protein n=1 Tax=Thalassomonas actiniarum TaxID=485447 RepID=A0AAE9YNT8_9GAMM|nr:alanine--glyoxylate aminotransferase family protein [Thalassomonas actiniarum]WDD98509.1 alanine--glyoxylate aminotransferase family protein [Thalassomonas actiniarum]
MNIAVPKIQPLSQILPEEPLLMMGAGPVPIPQAVANANGIVINHLGETMGTIVQQMKSMAGYIFQTQSPWIVGVAGPGSAAMEMAVANLVWENTRVLSICNGFFSSRLAQMAERSGGEVKQLTVAEGNSVEAELIRQQVEEYRPRVITIVQGETSNTTYNHELAAIGAIAKEYNCYLIVDAVCTLSTMPLKMDEWHIDAVITGGQKGLSSIPGVSLVAFSEKAWQRINSRESQIPQWTLDAKLASNFWHKNSYHYTAPVSGLLALYEAMRLICDETLPKRFRRHLTCSKALQSAIEALGLELYIDQPNRLNSVVGIKLPQGLEAKTVCEHISKNYRVEIAGSFGPPIVRIGQMGEQCREHNLFRTIHALGSTFKDLGVNVDIPRGMAELENVLQREKM